MLSGIICGAVVGADNAVMECVRQVTARCCIMFLSPAESCSSSELQEAGTWTELWDASPAVVASVSGNVAH